MVATTSGATSMQVTSIARRRSQDTEKQALALHSKQPAESTYWHSWAMLTHKGQSNRKQASTEQSAQGNKKQALGIGKRE